MKNSLERMLAKSSPAEVLPSRDAVAIFVRSNVGRTVDVLVDRRAAGGGIKREWVPVTIRAEFVSALIQRVLDFPT